MNKKQKYKNPDQGQELKAGIDLMEPGFSMLDFYIHIALLPAISLKKSWVRRPFSMTHTLDAK